MRPIPVASIVRVLTSACIFLSVTLIGFLPNRSIKSLLDSGASLNLIHEELVAALRLSTLPCASMYVTIANGSKLHHTNRVVILQFTLAGVQHEETFLVAPLGSNQLILGMPWLERVNPEINWKLRTLTYRTPTIHRIFNAPPHHDANPASLCPPSIKPLYPNSNHAPGARPAPIEHEPCSSIPDHTSEPQPVSMEDEQAPNIDLIPISKPAKKVRIADPCTRVPYRRPTPKTSAYKKYPI